MAGKPKVWCSNASQDMRIRLGLHRYFVRRIPQHIGRARKRGGEFPQDWIIGIRVDEPGDDCKEHLQPCALVGENFASKEVHGLNAVGTFVERDDTCVTKMLFDLVIHDIAMSTKDLYCQAGTFDGDVAAECFNDRSNQ